MISYTAFHGTRPDYRTWTVPFGKVAQLKAINHRDDMEPRAVYGITLGPKPMSTDTVKAYIPATKHIVTRCTRNIHILPDNVAPEAWGWSAQIAAPAFTHMPSKEPSVPNDDPPTEPTDDPPNVSTADPTQESNNAFSNFDEEADANITPFEELPDIHEEVSESEDEDNATEPLAIRFPADVWRRRETALQNDDDKDIEAYPIT